MSAPTGWRPLSEGPPPPPPPPTGPSPVLLILLGLGLVAIAGAAAAVVLGMRDTQRLSEGSSQPGPRALDLADNPDALFLMAAPRSEPMARPARFDAPWPRLDEQWGPQHPPSGWVESRLCAGDEAMWQRWHAALRAAPNADVATIRPWAWMVTFCQPNPWCDRLQALAAEPGVLGEVFAREDGACAPVVAGGDWSPDPPALQQLRAVGLLPPDSRPVVSSHEIPQDAGDLLALHGGTLDFDPETGMWPNQHETLLTRWAMAAGPPLDATLFWEDPPPPPATFSPGDGLIATTRPAGGAAGSYTLHAWRDGLHTWLPARDLDDWYDVDAALGLFNFLAATADRTERALVTRGGGNWMEVVVAPRDVLVAAVSQGLLDPPGAGGVEQAREEEARILERILQEEAGAPAGR